MTLFKQRVFCDVIRRLPSHYDIILNYLTTVQKLPFIPHWKVVHWGNKYLFCDQKKTYHLPFAVLPSGHDRLVRCILCHVYCNEPVLRSRQRYNDEGSFTTAILQWCFFRLPCQSTQQNIPTTMDDKRSLYFFYLTDQLFFVYIRIPFLNATFWRNKKSPY